MSWGNWTRIFLFCLSVGLAFFPRTVSACAACFGKSDSPLAEGMNMGILSLLVVVVSVLGGIAAFFVYLAKKSAAAAATPAPGAQPLSPPTR